MHRVIDEPTLTRLLGSIEANNLVLLCGAGVSIASPSNLLLARQVAQICYDKYRPVEELPSAFRDDICRLGECPTGSRKSAATVNTSYPTFCISAMLSSSRSRCAFSIQRCS